MAAAAASVAAGWAEEEFTDGELEVAAILCDLQAIVRARRRRRRRPEIPTWGRRRPRTLPVEKPAAVAVADRGEGAASPDTPLAFPEVSGGDDGEAAAKKKSRTHEQWVQEQRGVVANLSQENIRLLKQIEEYRARLQSSRSTNDSLKQMQSKLKQQRQQEEEQRKRKRKVQAEATAVDRPALGLDLNEPAEEDEEAKAQAAAAAAAAEWYYRGQQRAMVYKAAAAAAAARRRRREIRRAKVSSSAAASRTRPVG